MIAASSERCHAVLAAGDASTNLLSYMHRRLSWQCAEIAVKGSMKLRFSPKTMKTLALLSI
jgi:hypothetical protein